MNITRSPSTRKAWIEIKRPALIDYVLDSRLPHGRRGLKCLRMSTRSLRLSVAFHTEGVD